MPREVRARLYDIAMACAYIEEDVTGLSLRQYIEDRTVRQAVERNFEIIGEALNAIRQQDPQLAERVPHWRQIINMRNVLVHGYATIDSPTIYRTAATDVKPLALLVRQLLLELDQNP